MYNIKTTVATKVIYRCVKLQRQGKAKLKMYNTQLGNLFVVTMVQSIAEPKMGKHQTTKEMLWRGCLKYTNSIYS